MHERSIIFCVQQHDKILILSVYSGYIETYFYQMNTCHPSQEIEI